MQRIRLTCRAILACYIAVSVMPRAFAKQDPEQQPASQQLSPAAAVRAADNTPEQLQQLVAPIALYPDALVAQVLAASTYPDEVVRASQWIQDHPDLKGDALASEVDKQSWDPSVQALTGFPSVLGNMSKNLSWTSSLGDAYTNDETGVMDAVQAMRRRARDAGNLQDSAQQKVKTEGQTINIEPAEKEVVYVPQYDPWLVYGPGLAPWPGWYGYPGIFWNGPGIYFGAGFSIGFFGGFGWGFPHWRADFHHHAIYHGRDRFHSHGHAFHDRGHGHGGFGHGGRDRGDRDRGGRDRGRDGGSRGGHERSSHGGGFHNGGAFGGFHHGGMTHGFGERGRSSFGGGHHGGGFGGGRHR
jgi:hypothetical protein